MTRRRTPYHAVSLETRAARERGQALLAVVILLSFAAALLVYGSTSDLDRALAADHRTRTALEEARQALIGRAVADANRPGSLPCPDGNDDGSADLFVGSACPSYLGRLPWRTLGIGDLRDEHGERFWYALSPNFRDHPLAPALNSDTKGTLTVHHHSAATVVTTQAVAVIFSPGALLPGQLRDGGAATCPATGATTIRNRCATNYLDTAAGLTNAATTGPYIAAAIGEFFNDKITYILTADIMPLVEQRVALELRNALLAYRSASPCNCYPWPDGGNDGVSDPGTNRGRVPHVSAQPDPWGAGLLPAYFGANGWQRMIYYAVGRSALSKSGAGCVTCVDTSLSVDGASGYDVVLITPAYAGAGRPSPSWTAYVDDPQNHDADDRFVTPTSKAVDRDRLFAIAGPGLGCPSAARVLIDNAPCGVPGNGVRATCSSAAAALKSCTCASAADVMLKPPCTTQLDGTTCRAAVVALNECTL